jgi:hypothetical protein
VGLAYAAKVVVESVGCFHGAVAQIEALASIPTGEVSRRCTRAS